MRRQKRTATKSELVERLAKKMGTSLAVAESAYEAMVDVLAENIAEARGTSFRGVGIVTARKLPPRKLRVPVHADPVTVPERIACNFELVRAFADDLRAEIAARPGEDAEPLRAAKKGSQS